MTTILHLGLGSFHRAHQALYIHELRQRGDTEWSITGGNLRPDMLATMEALQVQGGAYTLETVTPQGEKSYARITSIQRVIPYQDDLAPLVAVGMDAATRSAHQARFQREEGIVVVATIALGAAVRAADPPRRQRARPASGHGTGPVDACGTCSSYSRPQRRSEQLIGTTSITPAGSRVRRFSFV